MPLAAQSLHYHAHQHRASGHASAWPGRVDTSCLHGNRSDWSHGTVIVPAVFREWRGRGPPKWLSNQYPVYLYQRLNESRPCYAANRGYESGVYFTFIAQHYHQLPAYTAFIQADWIFASKTNTGTPFKFWQLGCASEASTPSPWRDYMPLGLRHSVWPPRCVIRRTSWYSRFPAIRGNDWQLVELCARALLRILGVPITVRTFDRLNPLSVTFFPYMNFVASRERVRYYTHAAWHSLAHRFVVDGFCLPQTVMDANDASMSREHGSQANASGAARDPGRVVDSVRVAKYTLGMATELLQQSIFGFSPLERGPAPAVPRKAGDCGVPAKSKCSPTQ